MATITDPIISITSIDYDPLLTVSGVGTTIFTNPINEISFTDMGIVQYLTKIYVVPTPTPEFTVTVPRRESWI